MIWLRRLSDIPQYPVNQTVVLHLVVSYHQKVVHVQKYIRKISQFFRWIEILLIDFQQWELPLRGQIADLDEQVQLVWTPRLVPAPLAVLPEK